MKIKGFSFIETIFAVSIFLILMLVTYSVMDTGRKAWFVSDASGELRQNIIRPFMRMEKELKETSPGQVSLLAGSSSSNLTFKIPQDRDLDGTNLDSDGNIEWSDDITYALDLGSNQIIRTVSGTSAVIASNIVALQFRRPVTSSTRLQIDITARKNTLDRRVIQDAGQIILKMRN